MPASAAPGSPRNTSLTPWAAVKDQAGNTFHQNLKSLPFHSFLICHASGPELDEPLSHTHTHTLLNVNIYKDQNLCCHLKIKLRITIILDSSLAYF